MIIQRYSLRDAGNDAKTGLVVYMPSDDILSAKSRQTSPFIWPRRQIICVTFKMLKKAQCEGTQAILLSLQIKAPQIFDCSETSALVLEQP